MLVFDDAGIRNIAGSVVDNGVSLVIGAGEYLVLEADCPVFELAEAIAVELINLAGEDDLLSVRLIAI